MQKTLLKQGNKKINATDLGRNATDLGYNATDLGRNATDLGYNATDLGRNATDLGYSRHFNATWVCYRSFLYRI